MKTFDPVSLDFERCRDEVGALRNLLRAKSELAEDEDILPCFRKRPGLSAMCGFLNPHTTTPDLVAWEYDLFGDFACDLVVGDRARSAFTFVEFEDARAQSVFKKQGRKATREWSSRFDHGFSQIIDWFYKLADRRNSDEFETRFGKRSISFVGVLVAGRTQHFRPGESLRFDWRRDHVVVDSKSVRCHTLDELLEFLEGRLELIRPRPTVPQASPAPGK